MKFKVGDKVKIVKDTGYEKDENHGLKLGRIGRVREIEKGGPHPYNVQLRGRGGKHEWFNARELELVN